MSDKTSRGRTSFQGRGGNSGRGFGKVRGNLYSRGWCRGFNLTKPKVQGECEALVSDVYSVGDTQQADKYIKTTEAILNYIQGNFNKGNDVK